MALKSILAKPKQGVLFRNRLECEVCKERFWMTSKYLDHMATHKQFLLSCNICNKGFYDQKHLDEHYLTHTEVINTYDCNKCPKKFLQKYQLEQHIHFHSITSNEPATKKKKSVHFNNILESRDIIDNFSDNEQYFSDDDFSQDYNPVNKTTTTRSGRVVKPKKLFEYEQKVKRKYNRKSIESHIETSVNAEEDIHSIELIRIQNSNAQTIKAINVNTEKDIQSVKPIAIQNSNAQTIKAINVNTEKDIHSIKPIAIQNSNAQTIDKELRIISEKIPDELFKEYIAKGNICRYESQSSSKYNPECVQSNSPKLLSNDVDSKNDVQPMQVSKSSGITINPENSKFSKKWKEKNETSAIKLNINDSINIITVVTPPQLELCNKMSNIRSSDNSKLLKKSKENCPAVELSSATKTAVVPSMATPKRPQVGNGYVYVGTKPDINKIQKVIEEVKASMSNEKPALKTSEQVASKTSPTLSGHVLPAKHQSNNAYKINQQIKWAESILYGNLSHSEENGILDKKMVQDFLVIKVTPEYMQKMQRQNLRSAAACISSSNVSPDTNKNSKIKKILDESQTISPKVNDISLTSNVSASDEPLILDVETSEISFSNKGIEGNLDASQAFSPNVKDILSTSNISVSCGSFTAYDIKMLEEKCIEIALKKSKLIELTKKGEQMMPDELNCVSTLSREEKLLLRYKAKQEEKKRKKEEKYILKKKMRYAEKVISRKMNSKKKSSSKFSATETISKNVEAQKKVQEMKSKTFSTKNRKSVENIRKNDVNSLKKSNKMCSSNEDPYSNAPTVANNDISIGCPCNSKECFDTKLHMPNDVNVSKKSNSGYGPTEEADDKAIQKARDISEKFNKNLSEAEHLKLLSELHDLVKKFNNGKECSFLFPIVRFCRLYVDSYKVKEQAMSLGQKLEILKSK